MLSFVWWTIESIYFEDLLVISIVILIIISIISKTNNNKIY